ncbi:hypothetical protein EVAR_4178_1 [Eumeta japonica]|uniref:Uncharacterized protein n=1 Tax=Eumeta variegata TaxID=151549 RepID=A0A4C1TIK8_EUMVA|nr:hypothetical protein EVAR_4178_1 [Eumeta japonica]
MRAKRGCERSRERTESARSREREAAETRTNAAVAAGGGGGGAHASSAIQPRFVVGFCSAPDPPLASGGELSLCTSRRPYRGHPESPPDTGPPAASLAQ